MEAATPQVEGVTVANQAPVTQPVQPQPMQAPMPKSNGLSNINYVELLVGIGLITFFAFGIYYYKTQTQLVQKSIKTQDEKIEQLDSEVGEIFAQLQPQQ